MEATTTIVIYALMGVIIALSLWIMRLERRLNKFLYGKNAKSLEDTIVGMREGIEHLHTSHKETTAYLDAVDQRLRKSIRGVETIRFNPFSGSGSGGNQSFATAFLNEEGDGVVLSSLYSRDRVSVYAKPVKRFASPHELSGEEKDALKSAAQTFGQ